MAEKLNYFSHFIDEGLEEFVSESKTLDRDELKIKVKERRDKIFEEKRQSKRLTDFFEAQDSEMQN